MSRRDRDIQAERLTEARVFIRRDGSDDVVLRFIGSVDGEHHYIISRNEFLRLVRSLGHDAAKLSLMAEPAEAVQ